MNNYININIIYINNSFCFITIIFEIIIMIAIYFMFIFSYGIINKIYNNILIILKNTNKKNIDDNEFILPTKNNYNNSKFILSIDNDNIYKYYDNKKYYFNDFFSSHNIFENENININQSNKKKFKFKNVEDTDDVWGWFYIIDDEQLK